MTPCSASTAAAATVAVSTAGCVLAVRASSASGPSRHRRESEKPSASSASCQTAAAAFDVSANALAHADRLRALPRTEKGDLHRAPASYQRSSAAPQVKPPPNAPSSTRSPARRRLVAHASSRAT